MKETLIDIKKKQDRTETIATIIAFILINILVFGELFIAAKVVKMALS